MTAHVLYDTEEQLIIKQKTQCVGTNITTNHSI